MSSALLATLATTSVFAQQLSAPCDPVRTGHDLVAPMRDGLRMATDERHNSIRRRCAPSCSNYL